ncbi:MAG: 6-phosphofructokinase [Epsilonproteobacteria bacterium]|nr:6-phosphofructokinase [Campylobacterota bacterium]NPA57368.1 6-phosphofructokinase [Campylobacterota bacterium]
MVIAIMGSGGDAPGMNPAIKRFVEYLSERGGTPYFIYDGLEGLIDGKIGRADYGDVAGIIHRGGAIIGSSRSPRFFEAPWREVAFKRLQEAGIEGIVVLGGDGSFRAMELFHREFGVPFVGIPTTIDNDIYGTQYCLGVDTALNAIRDAVDRIRDTASTLKRAFVVETMGRECGYLAAMTALTCGAEVCLIPEVDFNEKVATAILREELERGRRYILAIVAEGTKRTLGVARWLEEDLGMETRVTILGHIQRGGNPTVRDRLMGASFVVHGIDHLLQGGEREIVIYDGGKLGLLPVEEVTSQSYRLDPEIVKLLNFLD